MEPVVPEAAAKIAVPEAVAEVREGEEEEEDDPGARKETSILS